MNCLKGSVTDGSVKSSTSSLPCDTFTIALMESNILGIIEVKCSALNNILDYFYNYYM